jgi:PTH1 family peptidyl-tRNA hydrolase
MKLIVGLGNPGEKYANNRHNVGFMAVDEIAVGYRFPPWKKRFQGLAAEGQVGTEKCILLKPSTYMNDSGRSVGEAARFYKIAVSDVIVIHDELDLKPGTIRVKTGGGNAGHNGLKSISANLGNDYVRVRIGIGHPGDKALVANYVLNDFAKADQEWLDRVVEGVARGMAKLVEGGEASFLSEATRVRPKARVAAHKLNGAGLGEAVREPVDAAVSALKAVAATVTAASSSALSQTDAALAAITAAASKPVQPMERPAIPVVSGREGGGGAVSRPVIMDMPPRPAEPAPAPAPAASQPPITVRPVEPVQAAVAPVAEQPLPAEPKPVQTPLQIVAGTAPKAPVETIPSYGAPPAGAGPVSAPADADIPVQPKAAPVAASAPSQPDSPPAAVKPGPTLVASAPQPARDAQPAASAATVQPARKGFGAKLKSWLHERARGKPLA